MKTLLLTAIAAMCMLTLQAQTKKAMNYNEQWQKVAGFEKKSLPESASQEVDNILRRAIAEKNSPQTIKALIHRGKYDLLLDAGNDTVIFQNLKEMLRKSTDVVEKSVLHSMLGELYLQYYQKDSWIINERTTVSGFVPADMKEWSKNNFYDKAVEHLNASIEPRTRLEKAAVQPYEAVVTLGKDSRRFYPAMYDFLVLRAIEFFRQIDEDADLSRSLAKKNITQQSLFAPAGEFVKLDFDPQPGEYNLWALETYKKLLVSLSERNLDTSVTLTELDRIGYLVKLRDAHRQYALPLLQSMLKEWENDPVSMEIADRMADIHTSQKELYDLLRKTIQSFPNDSRTAVLENRLSQLTQPYFMVKGNNTFGAKTEKKLAVEYKNLRQLNARLYRLDSPLSAVYGSYRGRQPENEKKTLIREIRIPLAPAQPYEQAETEFAPDVDEYGSYKLEFESDPATAKENSSSFYFSVSGLAVFSRLAAKDTYEFFVVDRITGQPAKDARVNVYKLPGGWYNSTLTLEATVPANELGLAVYRKNIPNNDVFYQAVAGNDNGSPLHPFPWGYYPQEDRGIQTVERIGLFTDRSLYRPGQTVFFKAVVTTTEDGRSQVAANKSLEFMLRDANGRELSRQLLQTNEFGSVSGEFVLPQGMLPGYFFIETENGSTSFRVEEYKRPSFEVTFDKIEKTYKFGEEITLTGKAENYSGIKLQNAYVNYRITRRQSGWWRWDGPPEHFTEGSVQTDEDGKFTVVFTPQKTDEDSSSPSVYTFAVEATVTDVNGETQVGNYSVAVGDISMMLNVEMPGKLEKSSAEKVVVSARNLDGNDIKASGTYRVFSLLENDSVGGQVLQGRFETGEQAELKSALGTLPSGKYRIRLQSADDRGNDITAERDFVLFAYSDKRPPIQTNEWFIVKNRVFGPGKNAEIILGATGDLHVLYELWRETVLLDRKWVKINNENRLFAVPFTPECQTGAVLMLTYVKEGKFYHHSTELVPEKERTGLEVKLDVFRDKIRPGAREEWRLTVKDARGNPAAAEVLASMYDFSLDQIYPASRWLLHQSRLSSYRRAFPLQEGRSFDPQRISGYIPVPLKNVDPLAFDRMNWFDFSLYRYRGIMVRGAKAGGQVESYTLSPMAKSEAVQIVTEDAASNVLAEERDASTHEERELSRRNSDMPSPEVLAEYSTPQIRRNFNETAFFFPQLRTNDKGETQIAFNVPESNTRWRFRVLAHDKNLNTGTAEAFAVSQKELMVTPNMPRFLRRGDRTSISAKISNLSDGTIDGNVKLELFNPVTDEVVRTISVENQSQPFSLAQGASSDASWMFDVPTGIDVIGVRIVAQSASFSDGEQHALAVLPNRMLVTESMRMDVNGTQTKEFTMDRLAGKSSNTIEDYRLTLEFTSNPAWYAVQALPVLSNPESDNAVSWFASYYANTLGMHISKTYPKVSAMIEAWKKQGGDSETLLSNLEKNPELKNVLLEETPWVFEAKNESEQKQKLALLFDLNRNQNLTRQAIDKLGELQTTQGGWSWFKGFNPSRSITQYILYGFNRLKELNATGFTDEIRAMQSRAVSYIDGEALRSFERMKQWNKDWRNIKSISVSDLEYVYVRSSYNQPPDARTKEMINFYTSVAEKNWTQYNLYERSLIALLAQRNGNDSLLQAILKSYREHAAVSDEMGMFWANNRAQVFMSQSAVSVHTFIMDAFRAGDAKTDEMDTMKRWLLKQKQTQLWESTHATMDAVYALLSTGSDWFTSENKTAVTIGNKQVEPAKQELGTGYFKETWHTSEIVPQMGHVKVENSGNAPAWGALYWQYYEELDKITKTDASLDVEKLLFVEETDTSGKKLIPITENRPLKIGDKVIVRLTVRTDRDLEFVHLKDMRAAAFEPVEQLSGVKWQGGTIYYQSSKDASTNFYFDVLPRGTYVFEYGVFVTRTGSYSNGITTIQCLYAPEFTSHTAGIRVNVKE